MKHRHEFTSTYLNELNVVIEKNETDYETLQANEYYFEENGKIAII